MRVRERESALAPNAYNGGSTAAFAPVVSTPRFLSCQFRSLSVY